MITRLHTFSLLALLLFTVGNLTVHAGTRIRRAAEFTSSLPVTIIESADFQTMNVEEVISQLSSNPTTLNSGQRATVRGFSSYTGLTDQQVDDQYNATGLFVLDGIRTLNRENSRASERFVPLLVSGRMSLVTGSITGTGMEVYSDGTSFFGDEAVNINWAPKLRAGQTDFATYDSQSLRLVNQLGRVLFTMGQDSYQGPPAKDTFDWAGRARINYQNYSLAYGAEYGRLSDLSAYLQSYTVDGLIPELATPLTRRILGSIDRDDSLNLSGRIEAANGLNAYILGDALPEAEFNFNRYELGVKLADYFVDGKFPSVSSYSQLLNQYGGYHFAWGEDTSAGFSHITIQVPPAALDETDVDNPVLIPQNSFFQKAGRIDGSYVEDQITIPELMNIYSGYHVADGYVVGGLTADGQNYSAYWFEDTDEDGLLNEESKVHAFTTDKFTLGVKFSYNEAFDSYFALETATKELFEIGNDAQGIPDAITLKGSLGSYASVPEIQDFSFSKDGNWAVGYNLGTSWDFKPNSFILEARYNESENTFNPQRLGDRGRDLVNYDKPAFSSVPWGGQQLFRATGKANSVLSLYGLDNDTWVSKGSAPTDGLGRVMIQSDVPLMAGETVRVGDADDDYWSVQYKVAQIPMGPMLSDPKRYGDSKLGVNFFYIPGTETALRISGSLREEWSEEEFEETPKFGAGRLRYDFGGSATSGFLSAVSRQPQPVARQLHFAFSPSESMVIYPLWYSSINGQLPYSALLQFSHPRIMSDGLDAMTSQMELIPNPFANQLELFVRILLEGYAEALNAIYVYPEYYKYAFPPVGRNESGDEVISARCLYLTGEHPTGNYPIVQFFIGAPDECEFFHWHSPLFSTVFHLDNDSTGTFDKDPFACGYGSIFEVPVVNVDVTLEEWNDVFDRHLRTGLIGLF